MPETPCQTLREELALIKETQAHFETALEGSATTGDFTESAMLKEKLEQMAQALKEKLTFGNEAILLRLKESGYLDASFEGKEVHPLTIRPLMKEQALDEYRNSGGKTWIWDELEKNMPYTIPKAEALDVMILNFGKSIGSDEALAEMDKLDVRPLTYEELIQYGITHPDHQKQKALVGLGTKHAWGGGPHAPVLNVVGGGRRLGADGWGGGWGGGCRFPVARK